MDPRTFPPGYFAAPVIGDSNLSVYIGGLSLINKHGSNWRAKFLDHLDDHRLNIRLQVSENGGPPKSHVIVADAAEGDISKVEVSLTHGKKISASYYNNISDNRHYGYMADFSSHELHGTKVKKNTTSPCRLLDFELNGGRLYTARLAQQNGKTPDLYGFDKPGNSERYIGHWAGIDIVGKTGSKLSIKINGKSVKIGGGDAIFQDGRRFMLMIDNMCTQSDCENLVDFAYYYRRALNGKMGMVDETPIDLVQNFKRTSPFSFKVACTAALSTANDT